MHVHHHAMPLSLLPDAAPVAWPCFRPALRRAVGHLPCLVKSACTHSRSALVNRLTVIGIRAVGSRFSRRRDNFVAVDACFLTRQALLH